MINLDEIEKLAKAAIDPHELHETKCVKCSKLFLRKRIDFDTYKKYYDENGNPLNGASCHSCYREWTNKKYRKNKGDLCREQHRLSKTKTYKVYTTMISRCHNQKDISYKWYGERGITVCDEWRNSFLCFVQQMGMQPPKMAIDRIDNNGNYCASNCRWVTPRENNQNTRQTRLNLDLVKEIIVSNKTTYRIARDIGVTENTVRAVRKNKTWKNVDRESLKEIEA